MKQYYIASLCREGILGGGIVADEDGITYKTGKVTVSPKLRNLEMKYSSIRDFSKKWVLFFPISPIFFSDSEVILCASANGSFAKGVDFEMIEMNIPVLIPAPQAPQNPQAPPGTLLPRFIISANDL